MSISYHRNGLASAIEFKCNSKKQYKCLNNHHFPLHLPHQTKHHSGDPRYAASKWYSINLQLVFRTHIIGGGGRSSTKILGMLNLPWQGFGKQIFTKIEVYAGMVELMLRYFEIEESLPKVKLWGHTKEKFMSKSQRHPSLHIYPIAWRLLLSQYFPSSMKVGLSDAVAPKQILSDSRKIGGKW